MPTLAYMMFKRLLALVLNGYSIAVLLAAAGIITFWHDILRAPWFAQALGAAAAAISLVLAILNGRAIWNWLFSGDAPSITQTMVHMAEGAVSSNLTMTGNVQMVSSESHPPRHRSRFRRRGSFDVLSLIKARLTNASQALIEALHAGEPLSLTDAREIARHLEAQHAARAAQELEFRRLLPEAVGAYQDAQERRYDDPEIDRHISTPHLAISAFQDEIATRMGAVAARIDPIRDSKHWWQRRN
jgi:hypothetical protein